MLLRGPQALLLSLVSPLANVRGFVLTPSFQTLAASIPAPSALSSTAPILTVYPDGPSDTYSTAAVPGPGQVVTGYDYCIGVSVGEPPHNLRLIDVRTAG
jgi:hypothetical protein